MSKLRPLLRRRLGAAQPPGIIPTHPRLRRPARAGQIGPIRREITFEPLPNDPGPAEPTPVKPEKPVETPQEQPVPT